MRYEANIVKKSTYFKLLYFHPATRLNFSL
jgi:hypothetical protein